METPARLDDLPDPSGILTRVSGGQPAIETVRSAENLSGKDIEVVTCKVCRGRVQEVACKERGGRILEGFGGCFEG
jgi:hypothetical protein